MFISAASGRIAYNEAYQGMILLDNLSHNPLASEQALCNTEARCKTATALYEIACAVFRLIAMTLQFMVVRIFVTVRHLPCFPSALPRKNLKVACRNIANFDVLQKCFATAWHPESKVSYQFIGREQGLCITHDIVLQPASGLCLGKSLTFLSEYLLAEEGEPIANLLAAAQTVQESKNEVSVRLQAIYDALIGIKGAVQSEEKDFFLSVLQGKPYSPQLASNQILLTSLEAFVNLDEFAISLRQFVFNDMMQKGINITPNLYALILELDTFWSLQQCPGERKNDAVHQAIIQAVAYCLKVESKSAQRMNGEIVAIKKQVEEMEIGSYLFQFTNHSIACVKVPGHLALFDPNEGLALFNSEDQQEGLLQLLEYYGRHNHLSLNVIELQPIKKCENERDPFLSSFD